MKGAAWSQATLDTHLMWCRTSWHCLWYCCSHGLSCMGATTSKGRNGFPRDA